MTGEVTEVVVPYSRFLEYQDRRPKVPELTRPDQPPTTNAEVPAAPDVKAPCSIG